MWLSYLTYAKIYILPPRFLTVWWDTQLVRDGGGEEHKSNKDRESR